MQYPDLFRRATDAGERAGLRDAQRGIRPAKLPQIARQRTRAYMRHLLRYYGVSQATAARLSLAYAKDYYVTAITDLEDQAVARDDLGLWAEAQAYADALALW